MQAAPATESSWGCAYALLGVSIAASGSTLWPMFAALAVVSAAAVVVPARDMLAARLWLSQHPLVGATAHISAIDTCGTAQETDARS